MIYDRILTVCDLLPGASPLLRKLRPVSQHYYCEREIYVSRFYAGKQAGVKLVRMVSMPRFADDAPINADQYAILDDGFVFRIEQIQRGLDDDGLPIATLSLAEPEGKYEILNDQASP